MGARMVRDAAAGAAVFPAPSGIVLGARAAILHGVLPPLAFASMIVDVTTEMLAQIAFIALGVVILSARAPQSALTMIFVISLAAAAVGGGLFLALQRYGHWMTEKLAARLLPGAVAPTVAVATSLDAISLHPTARRVFRGASLCRMDREARSGHGSPFA